MVFSILTLKLCHRRFKNVTFEDIQKVVENNDKKRFEMVFTADFDFEENENKEEKEREIDANLDSSIITMETRRETGGEESTPISIWWIKATQGHTMKEISVDLNEIILNENENNG